MNDKEILAELKPRAYLNFHLEWRDPDTHKWRRDLLPQYSATTSDPMTAVTILESAMSEKPLFEWQSVGRFVKPKDDR